MRASRKPCGNLMEQFQPIMGRANRNKIKTKTDFFYVFSGYYDVSNLVWGYCKILNTTLFFIEIPILKYHTYDFNPHVVSPCISSLLHPALKGSILFLRYPIYCQRRKFTWAIQAESSNVFLAVVWNRGSARYNTSNVIRNSRTITNAEQVSTVSSDHPTDCISTLLDNL